MKDTGHVFRWLLARVWGSDHITINTPQFDFDDPRRFVDYHAMFYPAGTPGVERTKRIEYEFDSPVLRNGPQVRHKDVGVIIDGVDFDGEAYMMGQGGPVYIQNTLDIMPFTGVVHGDRWVFHRDIFFREESRDYFMVDYKTTELKYYLKGLTGFRDLAFNSNNLHTKKLVGNMWEHGDMIEVWKARDELFHHVKSGKIHFESFADQEGETDGKENNKKP